jgi:hypothetical protein
VWQRGDVLEGRYAKARLLQRRNGRLPARTGTFDLDFNLPNAATHGGAGAALSRLLSSKGGTFPRTFEANGSRRAPTDCVTIEVRNRNQRIVKSRLYMDNGPGNALSHFSSCTFCHILQALSKTMRTSKEPNASKLSTLLLYALLSGHRLSWALTHSRIAARPLTPDGQALSVPNAPVAANVTKPSDILGHLASKLTTHDIVAVDYLGYAA